MSCATIPFFRYRHLWSDQGDGEREEKKIKEKNGVYSLEAEHTMHPISIYIEVTDNKNSQLKRNIRLKKKYGQNCREL